MTVVITKPNAINMTGLIYLRKCTLDTLTPSTNNKGAMVASIKSSESKLNSTGTGNIKRIIPNMI
jgi:hypothetical protein